MVGNRAGKCRNVLHSIVQESTERQIGLHRVAVEHVVDQLTQQETPYRIAEHSAMVSSANALDASAYSSKCDAS